MNTADRAKLKGNTLSEDLSIIDAEYTEVDYPVSKTKKPVGRLVECYQCGDWIPITETKPHEIEVESGRSGGSFTLGGSLWSSSGGKRGNRKGKGVRPSYNFGRTYFKKKTVRVCYDCLGLNNTGEEKPAATIEWWQWLFAIALTGVSIYYIGWWTLVWIIMLISM